MIELTLSQGQTALIDDCDVELADLKWSAKWYEKQQTFYAMRNIRQPRRKTLYLHRKVMERTLGRELETYEHVDHKNHNTLDNRRENLRLAVGGQNGANRKTSKNNTSGYKGVTWNKSKNKWKAQIKVDYKNKNLGSYLTAKDAAIAYNKAAVESFGEFALLNDV